MPRQPALKLDAMSVSELVQLRDKIHAALSDKIATEREELQRQMSQLESFGGTTATSAAGPRRGRPRKQAASRPVGNGKDHPLRGRTVAPKYRDPENQSQTWAGRGQPPRWLTAYEQQGRKREEFLIGATEGPPMKRGRRK
jgi:DNA-binding protein H-NS